MEQRPSQEGALPDPMVGLRYHNESFDRLTLGDSEFSYVELSLEQEVPFPGKLGLRQLIATREAERERAMRDATILMVLADTASRYHELALIERTTELLNESGAVLDLIVRQAAARYGVGEATQQDVLRASLERSALEERVTMLEQKRVAAESALNALLGRSAASPIKEQFVFTPPAPLEPLDQLELRLRDRAPDLRAAQEEVQRSDAALGLAERGYFPDFSLMGAYMNKDGLVPEWELGVRLTVPLYYWQRQRAAVTEQRQTKRAAEHARDGERLQLEARLRELHAMASTSGRLVDLYDHALIPEAMRTLESARASYEVGRVDLLTTLSAFTALLEYRIRAAEEQTNIKRARAEIGPLIGETPLGESLASAP
jgi:outer membrane protein TolC